MIPKLLHFNYFWDAIPQWLEANIAEFRNFNPGFEIILWNNLPDQLPADIRAALDWAPTYRFKSDLVRMWILLQYGGIYLDSDTRPINPFEVSDLLEHDLFVASYHGRIADNFFMGSVAGHELWEDGIARGLDRDSWPEPDRWFGTPNTITGPRPHYAFSYPKLTTDDVREIKDPWEWRELKTFPRAPLPDGPEYIKHYQLHGQVETIQDLKGWVVKADRQL